MFSLRILQEDHQQLVMILLRNWTIRALRELKPFLWTLRGTTRHYWKDVFPSDPTRGSPAVSNDFTAELDDSGSSRAEAIPVDLAGYHASLLEGCFPFGSYKRITSS